MGKKTNTENEGWGKGRRDVCHKEARAQKMRALQPLQRSNELADQADDFKSDDEAIKSKATQVFFKKPNSSLEGGTKKPDHTTGEQKHNVSLR
jgi:hypothetical protein